MALISVITSLGYCVLSRTSLLCGSNRSCQPQRLLCTSHFVSFCGHPPGIAICEKPELVREPDFGSLCLRSFVLSSLLPCSYSLHHRRGSEDMKPVVNWKQKCFRGVSVLPFSRVRQGGGEEDSRQQSAHVAPFFKGLRVVHGSRQGNHFSSPASEDVKLIFLCRLRQRSLSLSFKLVRTFWICRDTGQHCVHSALIWCAHFVPNNFLCLHALELCLVQFTLSMRFSYTGSRRL